MYLHVQQPACVYLVKTPTPFLMGGVGCVLLMYIGVFLCVMTPSWWYDYSYRPLSIFIHLPLHRHGEYLSLLVYWVVRVSVGHLSWRRRCE